MNTNRRSRLVVALVSILALCGLVEASAAARPAPSTAPGDPLDPRTYAPDSKLFLGAIGVQKYTCQANGTWLFTDPEATLYATSGTGKPVGTHFLNFATGRPVWQLEGAAPSRPHERPRHPAGRGTSPCSSRQP